MLSQTRHRQVVGVTCCVLLLACRSDGGETGRETSYESGMPSDDSVESETQDSLTLDLETRTVVRAVGSELADPESQKFVQFEITDVHNPKHIRLTFEVHYRLENGEETLLGTFALFPPHNPGDFIVATRGELRSEGAVVLSMQVLDEVGPEDEVRVTLKPISFREE